MIRLNSCKGELIQNVTLSNSPMFHISISGSSAANSTVQGVTILAPSSSANPPSHNTDACDVTGRTCWCRTAILAWVTMISPAAAGLRTCSSPTTPTATATACPSALYGRRRIGHHGHQLHVQRHRKRRSHQVGQQPRRSGQKYLLLQPDDDRRGFSDPDVCLL